MSFWTAHGVLGNLLAMHPALALLLLVPAGRHGLMVHTAASASLYPAGYSLAGFCLSNNTKGELWVTCNDTSLGGF